MLTAIEFDYQLFFNAGEIIDVGWNRMLATKLEATEVAIFQSQPEPQFGVG